MGFFVVIGSGILNGGLFPQKVHIALVGCASEGAAEGQTDLLCDVSPLPLCDYCVGLTGLALCSQSQDTETLSLSQIQKCGLRNE